MGAKVFGRFLIALAMMMIGSAAQAGAMTLTLGHPLCYAVTALNVADTALPSYACNGQPTGYQDRTLWLYADLRTVPLDSEGMTMLIHQTRFQRLVVRFTYADGVSRYQSVRQGDFGTHWRVGGQSNFYVPQRDSRLTSLTMRFDRLSSISLLRARFLGLGEAAHDVTILASLVGGAITLLALSAIYNLLLAVAVRRQFIAWHGAWAAVVTIWCLFWSQQILSFLPSVAGTFSSQICTFLATVAIIAATMCATACLGREYAPRWMRIGLPMLALLVAIFGIPGAIVKGPALDRIGDYLGYAILADLVGVMIAVSWAWRRGSAEARDFALAWTLPMCTLGLSQIVDLGATLYGGGAQIAVLIACSMQTVWLSIATSLRLARMRNERDAARMQQQALTELARRDPLTGLLNRRGFTAIVSGWLAHQPATATSLGLLIIDVDHFKTINDRLGHEAGDKVLQQMAGYLTSLDGDRCCTGRFGGEEFAVAIRNLEELAFRSFADKVRRGLAKAGIGGVPGEISSITVSIGACTLGDQISFQDIYRAADEALYVAKRAGRNRVAIARPGGCIVLKEGGILPESEPAETCAAASDERTPAPLQHAASIKRCRE
jgi:diguanylate cyclase (GGDEF)-like protein